MELGACLQLSIHGFPIYVSHRLIYLNLLYFMMGCTGRTGRFGTRYFPLETSTREPIALNLRLAGSIRKIGSSDLEGQDHDNAR